jgi:hypothetical protein
LGERGNRKAVGEGVSRFKCVTTAHFDILTYL